MGRSLQGVTLLLAACTSAPIDRGADEVVGHYRMVYGIDNWSELDLKPDGLCTWWSCSAAHSLTRVASPGRWRVERDHLAIELDGASRPVGFDGTGLRLRRWEGHVYLVPGSHLAWFDHHGPDEESCFHADTDPLPAPTYRLPDATQSNSR